MKKRPIFQKVLDRLEEPRKFIQVLFVLKHGKRLTAIEVKSGFNSIRTSGMDLFAKKFNPSRIMLVGNEGIPLDEFLSSPITSFVE